MAEEIGFENGRNSNFQGLVTLTLTLDPAIRHTVVHHSSTSTYTPNFIQIEETFCGLMDGRTYGRTFFTLSNIIRLTFGSWPNNDHYTYYESWCRQQQTCKHIAHMSNCVCIHQELRQMSQGRWMKHHRRNSSDDVVAAHIHDPSRRVPRRGLLMYTPGSADLYDHLHDFLQPSSRDRQAPSTGRGGPAVLSWNRLDSELHPIPRQKKIIFSLSPSPF